MDFHWFIINSQTEIKVLRWKKNFFFVGFLQQWMNAWCVAHPFVINFQFHNSVNNSQKWFCLRNATVLRIIFLGKKSYTKNFSFCDLKGREKRSILSWSFWHFSDFCAIVLHSREIQLKGNCVCRMARFWLILYRSPKQTFLALIATRSKFIKIYCFCLLCHWRRFHCWIVL